MTHQTKTLRCMSLSVYKNVMHINKWVSENWIYSENYITFITHEMVIFVPFRHSVNYTDPNVNNNRPTGVHDRLICVEQLNKKHETQETFKCSQSQKTIKRTMSRRTQGIFIILQWFSDKNITRIFVLTLTLVINNNKISDVTIPKYTSLTILSTGFAPPNF